MFDLCIGLHFYVLSSFAIILTRKRELVALLCLPDVLFVCLFDLFLYVHSTIFQLCGTVLPGFNQY